MGNTALVTGASSGIGTELAKYHASKGGDVVLVARSEDKLNELKAELESDYGITATVIASDLAQPDAAGKIFSATKAMGLQIDVLINNAGFGGHGKFHERDLAKDQAMMQVNGEMGGPVYTQKNDVEDVSKVHGKINTTHIQFEIIQANEWLEENIFISI
jgi:short-subunit dehydrogenase